MREAPPVYRPRHPERTALYQLFEGHGERYLRVHAERFEPRDGALRPSARAAIDRFLECGRLQNGFARIRCPGCRGEHLLAFSCRVRNLCPSCQMKRAQLLASHLVEELLLPAAHVHVVFTIPKRLRGLLQRDRRLLGVLSREAYRAWAAELEADAPVGARAAMVGSIQTFGAEANWHPHLHALAPCGVVLPGGRVLRTRIDAQRVHDRFRVGVLQALVKAKRLTPAFAERLLSWENSGFSVFVGPPIEAHERASLLRVSRYLVRPAVAYRRVVREGNRVRILSSSPDHPGDELDPLDALHRLLMHVPVKGQHQVRYYGAYANRARVRYRPPVPAGREAMGEGPSTGAPVDPDDALAVARRQSWARLLARVFEVDPLRCPRCGEVMQVVGFVTQPAVIDKILRHRKAKQLTSPFESRAPPAA